MKWKEVFIKVFHVISGIAFVVGLLIIGYWLLVPLSRPESLLRNYVYQIIPYHTTWDDAISILERSSFPEYNVYPDSGMCLNVYSGQVWIGSTQEHGIANIGEKSIRIHLGHYYNPLWTDVIAYLAFDDDMLTHIEFKYEIDSL